LPSLASLRLKQLVAIGVGLLVLVGCVWISGVASGPLAKLQFRRYRTEYQAAATAVIAAEATSTPEGGFAFHLMPPKWHPLTRGRGAWYFKMNGRDYVYFCLHDEVTMGDGLYYSPTGTTPPEPAGRPLWTKGNWSYGGMGNGYIESHMTTSSSEVLSR
jgi:hypothetical protein